MAALALRFCKRALETRGRSSDGETEALENDARTAPVAHLCELQSVSLGNPRFVGFYLHGRPTDGSGRIVFPEHDVNHNAFQMVDIGVRGRSRRLTHRPLEKTRTS